MTIPAVRMTLTVAPVFIATLTSACASVTNRSDLSIRPVTDTVALLRTNDVVWFRAAFVIRNVGTLPLYGPTKCGDSMQREIQGVWETVWTTPACVASGDMQPHLAPGDSTTRPVLASTFGAPRVLEPGRYRAVFTLGSRTIEYGLADLLPFDRRVSSPFIVRDTRQK
jgi:hypothetical protein